MIIHSGACFSCGMSGGLYMLCAYHSGTGVSEWVRQRPPLRIGSAFTAMAYACLLR